MRIVFYLSVVAIVGQFVMGFFLGALIHYNYIEIVPSYLGDLITVLTLLSVVTVLVLWIDGWKKMIKSWKSRTTNRNAILCLFLLIGNVIAAYYFYFHNEYDL